MIRTPALILCLLALSLAVFAPAARPDTPPHYQVTILGPQSGNDVGSILLNSNTINAEGNVVGYSFTGIDYNSGFFIGASPFLFKNGQLLPLPLLPGWPETVATGINNPGVIIGEGQAQDTSGNYIHTPMEWIKETPYPLGIPSGYDTGFTLGINNHGDVVGDAFNLTTGSEIGLLWSQRQMTTLPLPSGAIANEADAINDAGKIAGTVWWSDRVQAVLYDHGTVIDLGDLGSGQSWAAGMNTKGEIVGFSLGQDNATFYPVLWRWGNIINLGLLNGNMSTFGIANAVNNKGQVVGFSDLDHGQIHAFLWQNGVMYDLNDLIADYPDTEIINAFSINNQGQIAAFGRSSSVNGIEEALLLTPSQ